MRGLIPATAVLGVLVVIIVGQAAGIGGSTPTTPSAATPRWVTHVARYPGGLSGTVRAVYAARGQNRPASAAPRAGRAPNVSDNNVQMNDDSYPPMPQNETAVAYNVTNPKIAVAAANDYVSGGVVVMRTSDSGRNWSSTRISPQFRGTGDFCTGGDPGVAYSRRDNAFYISQLCFFRALPFSEVQVFKSVDDGADLDARPPGCACGVQLRLLRRARSTSRSSTTRSSSPSTTIRAARTTGGSTSRTPSSTFSRTGSATTARSSSPTQTRSPLTTPYSRRGRTLPSSRTTPVATALGPRPTSSATLWSRGTARSTSGSSPRTATTRSTRTCSSRGRPTVGRHSSRTRCRSTSPASTRTSTTAPVPTRSRQPTSGRRTPRRSPTARRPASCCSSTRTTSTGRPRRPTSPTRPPTDGGLHWSDASVPVDRLVRPARRSTTSSSRGPHRMRTGGST